MSLSCGDYYLDWDTESAVGCTYRIPAVTLKNKAPRTKEYLSTCLHEGLHVVLPDATEAEVVKLEKDLATILWTRGFRLRPPKGKKRKPRPE